MEEEIAEFEEEGGLALSIVIWLFALAAPCGVLLVRPAPRKRLRKGAKAGDERGRYSRALLFAPAVPAI